MKKFAKILALLLALVMVLSCVAGCKKQPSTDENKPAEKAEYTNRGYTTQLGTNWNPHTWETDYDNGIMQYLETPLATMSIKDSENGVYQWVFKAATSVTDVTADHKDHLTKYQVTLPKGQTVEQIGAEERFVLHLIFGVDRLCISVGSFGGIVEDHNFLATLLDEDQQRVDQILITLGFERVLRAGVKIAVSIGLHAAV